MSLSDGLQQFTVHLKCGRRVKGGRCRRTLGSTKMNYRRASDGVWYPVGLDDWLSVNAKESVPWEPYTPQFETVPQRYKFTCAYDVRYRGEGMAVTRGRDREGLARVGCRADHVVRHDRLEEYMLFHLRLEELRPLDHDEMLAREHHYRVVSERHWEILLE